MSLLPVNLEFTMMNLDISDMIVTCQRTQHETIMLNLGINMVSADSMARCRAKGECCYKF
jgi:hypothetical protein